MPHEEDERLEVRSVCLSSSRSSLRSRGSSTNMAAVEARARAEAERARAAFAKKEMEVRVKQAQLKVEETRLEAMLHALRQEEEVEAALAEANVFETAANTSEAGQISVCGEPSCGLPGTVRECGDDLSIHKDDSPTPNTGGIPTDVQSIFYSPQFLEESVLSQKATRGVTPPPSNQHSQYSVLHHYHNNRSVSASRPHSVFNNDSPPIRSHTPQGPGMNSDVFDFARYLAKRDLVSGGLTRFTDKSEDFWAWKTSFCNTIEGLNLKSCEELDLLIKWLGDESSVHAKRIRSVHISHPAVGLRMVWERLEECYGTPEALEKALFDRIELFPRLSSTDHHKLRELGIYFWK